MDVTHRSIRSHDAPTIADAPHVLAPPPVLFGCALLVGFLLQRLAPMPLVHGKNGVILATELILIAGGLWISGAVMRVFAAADTPVVTWQPVRRLVRSGPYRFSRNPDYIGQLLVYLGAGLLMNTWWPTLLVPVVLFVIDRTVVRREEQYLERLFGQEYRDFKSTVRRWL